MSIAIRIKKISAIIFSLLACTINILPVMATDVTSGTVLNNTGLGGASLNSVSGAVVSTDYTNATITNTQATSTLNWNALNTGANQSLKYVFNSTYGNNQVSLNKITGGLSTFAGHLTSEGSGRVIISNPNGMLFENGSYTNVNALTLTTKNVYINPNNDINLSNNNSTGTITIGQGGVGSNAAIIQVADDINIVAPVINVNEAKITTGIGTDGKILSGGGSDIRLITADGVTFYATPVGGDKFKTTLNSTNVNDTYNITVQKAEMAVKNNSDGTIHLLAKGDISTTDLDISENKSVLYAGNNLNLNNSKLANSKITAINETNISNSSTISANSSLYSGKDINVSNSSVVDSTMATAENINVTDSSTFSNTKAFSQKTINYSNSIADTNSYLSGLDINASKSLFDNSTFYVKNNLNIYGSSSLTNCLSAKVLNDINIYDSGTTISSSNLYATGKLSVSGGASIEDDSFAYSGKGIDITSSIIKDSALAAVEDINVLNNSSITNSSLFTSNNINTKTSSVSGSSSLSAYNIDLDNSFVNNSIISARNNLNIYGGSSIINSLSVKAVNDIIVRDTNTTVNNSNLYATGKASFLNGALLENNSFTYSYGEMTISSSAIKDSSLASENCINVMNNSSITNSSIHTSNDIIIADSSVSSNSLLAGNNLKLKNTSINDVLLTAKNNISVYDGSNLVNVLSAKAANDIYITGSGTTVSGSNLYATNNVGFSSGAIFKDSSYAYSNKNIYFTGSSLMTNSRLSAGADLSITGSTLNDTPLLYAVNTISLINSNLNNTNISGNNISSSNSQIQNSTLSAKNNISIYGDSSLISCLSAKANNDIYITGSGTTVSGSNLYANNISFAEGAAFKDRSYGYAAKNINVNSSNINTNSSLSAKDSLIIKGGSLIDNASLLYAYNTLSIANSTVNSSYLTSQNINFNASTIDSSSLFAQNCISAYNSSTLQNITSSNATSFIITNSNVYSSLLNGNYIKVNNSLLDDTNLIARYKIIIEDTTATNSLTANATKEYIKLTNVTGGANATLTAGSVDIDNSTLGDSIITSTIEGVNVKDSTLNSAYLYGVSDMNVTDSLFNNGVDISTSGNVNLKGIYVDKNLTISKAADVLISNSDSASTGLYPTILDSSKGLSSVSDYNINNTSALTASYGSGTRESYVGGNLTITGVNNSIIAKTLIKGSLNQANIAKDSNLIASYVGGDYNPSRTTIRGDENVYNSYIKGSFTKYYQLKQQANEVDKQKITKDEKDNKKLSDSKKIFTPKGFAAKNHKTKEMKHNVMQGLRRGHGNSIMLTKGFFAY